LLTSGLEDISKTPLGKEFVKKINVVKVTIVPSEAPADAKRRDYPSMQWDALSGVLNVNLYITHIAVPAKYGFAARLEVH